MKKHLAPLIMAATLLLNSTSLLAQDSDARVVSIANPVRSNGIHIGDVLERTVTLDVKSPYQIGKDALPMKGSNQNGMELVDFKLESASNEQGIRYHIDYRYQVFAHAKMPTVMQLPAEKLPLTGGPKALTVNVPAWHFWFSPLVNADLLTAKANLQPQQKPELVDAGTHRTLLAGFISLLLAGLVGLLYFNADRRWLPFMGGAFAQAHRRIKRLSGKLNEEKTALTALHQAFNQVHGSNLFARDLAPFLQAHPAFARMQQEIEAFFRRSNQALFDAPPDDRAAFIRELVILSKALRDCERGLR